MYNPAYDRTFRFDSGTEIRIFWSMEHRIYRASMSTLFRSTTYGFGKTKLVALRAVRAHIVNSVTLRIKIGRKLNE